MIIWTNRRPGIYFISRLFVGRVPIAFRSRDIRQNMCDSLLKEKTECINEVYYITYSLPKLKSGDWVDFPSIGFPTF